MLYITLSLRGFGVLCKRSVLKVFGVLSKILEYYTCTTQHMFVNTVD